MHRRNETNSLLNVHGYKSKTGLLISKLFFFFFFFPPISLKDVHGKENTGLDSKVSTCLPALKKRCKCLQKVADEH